MLRRVQTFSPDRDPNSDPKPSPCLDPTKTAYQKMIEAIQFAEENRADGDEILQLYRPQVMRDLIQRHQEAGRKPPTKKEIEVATELRASETATFKTALSNERWGWRLALMYAAHHHADQELSTQGLLSTLVTEVRGLRADLAQFAQRT